MVHAVSFALKKAETLLEKLEAMVLAGYVREGGSGQPSLLLARSREGQWG